MAHRAHERDRMVETQIAGRGVHDAAVLAAMRIVPREAFVPAELAPLAYRDGPLPIGGGQTISQPLIVAEMIEAAAIGAGDRLLEVGLGSGYAAAVASRIAAHVHAIDRLSSLVDEARARLARLGYDNVAVRAGDGSLGWPEAAPFDAILVSAASPQVPPALKTQLAVGGRLVIPVGSADSQQLVRIIRHGPDDYERQDCGWVRFVPLIGEQGWH